MHKNCSNLKNVGMHILHKHFRNYSLLAKSLSLMFLCCDSDCSISEKFELLLVCSSSGYYPFLY